jgi:hypothetical protein
VDRRQLLAAAGLSGLIVVIAGDRWNEALDLVSAPRAEPRFLTSGELGTLRAITARLLPGPPEDPDPGAVQAHCAEAIDMVLGAFTFDPPLLFSGGPWSDRAGGRRNAMAQFVPPDELQVLSWRIRLEGSLGLREREFAGSVVGLQTTYRQGLTTVDALAARRGGTFLQLPAAAQDTVLRLPAVADFVGQVLSDGINAMYGPPEYGGNHDLVGWRAIGWPGDVQPRGYSDGQVKDVDVDAGRLPYSTVQARAVAARVLPGIRLVD